MAKEKCRIEAHLLQKRKEGRDRARARGRCNGPKRVSGQNGSSRGVHAAIGKDVTRPFRGRTSAKQLKRGKDHEIPGTFPKRKKQGHRHIFDSSFISAPKKGAYTNTQGKGGAGMPPTHPKESPGSAKKAPI